MKASGLGRSSPSPPFTLSSRSRTGHCFRRRHALLLILITLPYLSASSFSTQCSSRTNNAAKVPYYYSPLRTAALRAFDASSNHRLSTVVKVPLLPSKIGHRLSLANVRAFGDHPAESHPHNEEEEEEDDEGFDLGFHEVGADFEFEDEEVLGDTANKMEQDGRIEAELPVEETPLFKFKQLGLKGPLLRAVESLGYTEPSPIQQAAIPLILNRESIIAAAQTGTGKTMAYMAPLAQLLKNDEAKRKETQTRSSRPKALILVPNRELALQAMGLAKTLSHEVKLSSALITGGGQRSQENKRCKRDIDLLVATPGRARQLFLEERRLFFSELKYVVIDEADTMFDPSNGFGQEMESLLVPIENSAKFAAGKKKLQFILVTASLKGRIAEGIQKRLPGLKRAQTKDFQQLLDTSRLSLRMVDASRRDKQVVLAEVLNSAKESMGGSTVVFCNTIDSARATDLYLKEAGFDTSSFHGEVPPQYRSQNYLKFARGEVPILVTTDIAARGLDTSFVKHVVLFDFPRNPVDFIHRVGRTARGNANGRATCLVTKKDKALADAIERAWRQNKPIDKLSWNRESNDKKLSDSTRRRNEAGGSGSRSGPSSSSSYGRRRGSSVPGGGGGRRRGYGGTSSSSPGGKPLSRLSRSRR